MTANNKLSLWRVFLTTGEVQEIEIDANNPNHPDLCRASTVSPLLDGRMICEAAINEYTAILKLATTCGWQIKGIYNPIELSQAQAIKIITTQYNEIAALTRKAGYWESWARSLAEDRSIAHTKLANITDERDMLLQHSKKHICHYCEGRELECAQCGRGRK